MRVSRSVVVASLVTVALSAGAAVNAAPASQPLEPLPSIDAWNSEVPVMDEPQRWNHVAVKKVDPPNDTSGGSGVPDLLHAVHVSPITGDMIEEDPARYAPGGYFRVRFGYKNMLGTDWMKWFEYDKRIDISWTDGTTKKRKTKWVQKRKRVNKALANGWKRVPRVARDRHLGTKLFKVVKKERRLTSTFADSGRRISSQLPIHGINNQRHERSVRVANGKWEKHGWSASGAGTDFRPPADTRKPLPLTSCGFDIFHQRVGWAQAPKSNSTMSGHDYADIPFACVGGAKKPLTIKVTSTRYADETRRKAISDTATVVLNDATGPAMTPTRMSKMASADEAIGNPPAWTGRKLPMRHTFDTQPGGPNVRFTIQTSYDLTSVDEGLPGLKDLVLYEPSTRMTKFITFYDYASPQARFEAQTYNPLVGYQQWQPWDCAISFNVNKPTRIITVDIPKTCLSGNTVRAQMNNSFWYRPVAATLPMPLIR